MFVGSFQSQTTALERVQVEELLVPELQERLVLAELLLRVVGRRELGVEWFPEPGPLLGEREVQPPEWWVLVRQAVEFLEQGREVAVFPAQVLAVGEFRGLERER